MKTSVEVIIHPVCLRFSYHNNEIVYMFASNPEQQLDEMEKLMGVGTDQGPIFDSNVGFLPVASTILIRGEKTILVDPGNYHIGFYSMLKRALNSKNLTYEDIDMIKTKKEISNLVPREYQQYLNNDNKIISFNYPMLKAPEKIKSINLEKTPHFNGELTGIKGQYLIFNNEHVINVRKYTGYVLDLIINL